MEKTQLAFLDLLRAVLHERKPEDPQLSPAEWEELLRLSEAHKLLPLILDASLALPSCRAAISGAQPPFPEAEPAPAAPLRQAAPQNDPAEPPPAPPSGSSSGEKPAAPNWKELALEQSLRQAVQENEFLDLMLALRERGLTPAVLKGPVCRALYPKPLLRPSVDDDLLIPDAQTAAFHAALLELGLTADEPAADPERAWELSYHKLGTPLYIELHRRLFDPNSPVFERFNDPFEGALDRTEPVQIQDVQLLTLAPSDQLLFLLLHAFKHFLFCGIGVRIVADICLFTGRYAERIDFARIREVCDGLRCERFAAAVYRIGEKYLDLPAPEAFSLPDLDETELLDDVLIAGLHGAEIDRLHSAHITLGAVADGNSGEKAAGGLRRTLFPDAKQLSGRYPYLEKRPWLVPVAWVSRTASYLKERGKYGEQSPAATLRIGAERVRLLEHYGVIDPR